MIRLGIRRRSIQEISGDPQQYAELVALQQRDPAATPFQHPAFLVHWWNAVGKFTPGLEGFLLVGTDEQGCIAWYFPVAVEAGPERRVLKYLGDPFSDYHVLVCDPAVERDEVLNDLLTYLLEAPEWDAVSLGEWREVGGAPPTRSEKWTVGPGSICPFLDLTDAAAVEHAVGKREYLAKGRRLARIGDLELREAVGAEDLEGFIAMHLAQWKNKNAVGGFEDPEVGRFFRGITDVPEFGALARLFVFTLDKAAIAYYFCFVEGSVCYGYRTTFDTELRRFSPGALLLSSMIDQLSRRGFTEFDFMRGGYSYKGRFASGVRQNLRIGTVVAPVAER